MWLVDGSHAVYYTDGVPAVPGTGLRVQECCRPVAAKSPELRAGMEPLLDPSTASGHPPPHPTNCSSTG